jgi:parallel beta-helix repeat protein
MRLLLSWLTVFLAFGFGLSVRAANYHVAQRHPQAADDGPGSAEQPWKTISQSAKKIGPGDSVLIHDGVYREAVILKTSGTAQAPIRFQAAPGEHVVLTGADRMTGWQKADGAPPVYHVNWPHRFITWSKTMAHPDDNYHLVIGRCEQVAVDAYLLRPVLSESQLAPGTFFADTEHQTLYVWDIGNRDPNKTLVEASVRQEIFSVAGDYVELRGLHFRYAANMAQHGAVVLAGAHGLLEDCIVESMNASGATFAGPSAVVRRCVFRDNGQLGFGASHAHNLWFTQCLVENNNTKNFDRGWEAGGCKLVLSREAVLEGSRFVRNRGNGVWFDIGNENCTVRQCLIADNEDAGIFYEISFGLRALDNVIAGNGFAATAGAWGAQAGISLSSSPDCIIERNLIFGNREGFDFREQTRTTRTIGERAERPVWNHDEVIRHNLLVFNRDAQVWAWFDVKDGRHWPAGKPADRKPDSAALPPPGDIAGPYAAKGSGGQPKELSLEKLRLRFESNIYFASPGQGGFNWGPSWARHKRYSTFAEFQSDLGVDRGSQELDPGFADVLQRDFRLTREMFVRVKECYPQGRVPEVQLGVLP